jgi:mono/diheme cytochrome c family protein
MNRITISAALLCLCSGAWADHAIDELTADTARGGTLYQTTCIACHGPRGKSAIPGVPDFTAHSSRLVLKDTATLLHNVDRGFQSPGSMMAMPPKGANPSLSTQDIFDILSYMRAEFAGLPATVALDSGAGRGADGN